uniref:Uncharacterized protein n=1 Tax=Nelumbo nucifera TaxID=4432 RepID=A0A822YP74_NELNU|nr:TPA_asm: hypothetical protein HUJ06_009919 [Nelumbo nucifera]
MSQETSTRIIRRVLRTLRFLQKDGDGEKVEKGEKGRGSREGQPESEESIKGIGKGAVEKSRWEEGREKTLGREKSRGLTLMEGVDKKKLRTRPLEEKGEKGDDVQEEIEIDETHVPQKSADLERVLETDIKVTKILRLFFLRGEDFARKLLGR